MHPSLKLETPVKRPVDHANGLVGTAPLDSQILIGNAPPPGEKLYSGFTSTREPACPTGQSMWAPINENLDLSYSAGVRASYFYPNRMMFGFSGGTSNSLTLMPVVGNWTVPPERSGSVYDKAREHASPGYYSVYLDDFKTKVELTATTWTGLYRITFPRTNQAHLLLDLGRAGGTVEIVGDNTVRGEVRHDTTGRGPARPAGRYVVARFSRPFRSFGTFSQILPAQERRQDRRSETRTSNLICALYPGAMPARTCSSTPPKANKCW